MSKIYASQAGFQPQDLVQRRLPEYSKGFRAAQQPKRRDFVNQLLAEKPAPIEEVEESDGNTVPPIEEDEEEILEEAAEDMTEEEEDETFFSPVETEHLVSDAYQRGRQEGMAAGRQQVQDDFDDAIAVVLNIGQELDNLRQTILANSQSELQALALAIAEKLTRRSVQEQNETIIHTVEEAIRLAISSEEIVVLVNPADYEAIMAKSDEMRTGVTGLRALTIRADGSIERGGCRLESDNCIVDATLAGQLADIAIALQFETQS